MTIAEKIFKKTQSLPEDKQAEVLDFVDFLERKLALEEDREWAEFSLASALRGMEDEEELYTLDDLKERFHD